MLFFTTNTYLLTLLYYILKKKRERIILSTILYRFLIFYKKLYNYFPFIINKIPNKIKLLPTIFDAVIGSLKTTNAVIINNKYTIATVKGDINDKSNLFSKIVYNKKLKP